MRPPSWARAWMVSRARARASGLRWRTRGRDHLLEQGRLALGEQLVHAQVAGFEAVVGELAGQPEQDQVVAPVPGARSPLPRALDEAERLQFQELLHVGAGGRGRARRG